MHFFNFKILKKLFQWRLRVTFFSNNPLSFSVWLWIFYAWSSLLFISLSSILQASENSLALILRKMFTILFYILISLRNCFLNFRSLQFPRIFNLRIICITKATENNSKWRAVGKHALLDKTFQPDFLNAPTWIYPEAIIRS